MSLALSTLIYEWRRYLAAVVALAVAGLLVLAMTGMFMGMSKSFTATVDRSPAQVMILPPDSDSLFGNNSGQPRRNIPEIYEHPDVLEVQPLNGNWAFWSNFPKEGQTAKGDGVRVIIVDPVKGAVTLPNDFGDDIIQALQEPYAVVVDRSSLGKLGVQLGDKAKMDGITVWVRALTAGYPSMFNSAVFVSRQTAKLLFHNDDGPRVGALLVKIKNPSRAKQVAAELNILAKGHFKAWSREDLSVANQRSMLKEGGIVVMIGFAVVVGAFIGIVITWQTLQGALLANIKEFASLRALGVSMGSLRLIVMELSLWVGLAGLTLTAALTGMVGVLARAFGVPMDFPLFLDVPVAVTLLLIAALSGVLSLGVLKKSQPADLLR
ncbi:MAG TPA: ABC transporter permease [Steroidobacteraceae bacterium]|nr:ABC transporter permease [Steroidobacteraceae bacterium]